MYKLLVITVASKIGNAASVDQKVIEFETMGSANVAHEILKRNKSVFNGQCVVDVNVIKLY